MSEAKCEHCGRIIKVVVKVLDEEVVGVEVDGDRTKSPLPEYNINIKRTN